MNLRPQDKQSGLLRRAPEWGGIDFHDQLGHIVCHLDKLNHLVGHLDQLYKYLDKLHKYLDQLHKYKKIQRISQKDKEL